MTKVIIDTDVGNEIDDIFAIAYLLASEKLEFKAVTIEPFTGSILYPGCSIEKANEISRELAEKVLELAGKKELSDKVNMGAEKYYKDAPLMTNPAVEAMADIVRKDPDTVIAAIGTPVNVALFLNIYPELACKTKVVWLGGNSLGYPNNHEFNFSQDIQAVRKLFDCCENLTVMPCKNIASNLSCPECELRENIGGSLLGDFLLERYVSFRDVVWNRKSNAGYAKILWDISVIAYLIDSSWFETKIMPSPLISDDEVYDFNANKNTGRKTGFVINLNRNLLMNDFFENMKKLCFGRCL